MMAALGSAGSQGACDACNTPSAHSTRLPVAPAFLHDPPGLQLAAAAQVVVSSFDETLPKEQYSAADYARHTALHKAVDVAKQLTAAASGGAAGSSGSSGAAPPDLVIGADTVVEYGEHILEKPRLQQTKAPQRQRKQR